MSDGINTGDTASSRKRGRRISSTMQLSGDQKPFIVANLKSAASETKRRRTANDVNKNCNCCLVYFYVSFKELD
ncbi:hypothetical protein AVEN_87645-1 [Araneus ventricosus]|uniref:Uncharacterized protein n=1 Tax=Araneus ventricosus TaxID=182803 RepID=A0A4Y2VZ02_ARAVE|nr:hypothetical protein AVEN_85029-1 [Araneus ventricosus]GBO30873.1 hypothetical protein AVEN_87645-1 [Araneus ventricosus]